MAPSPYVEDATGAHEWNVTVTGSGRVSVYRDGGVIDGTWERPALGDRTRFVQPGGLPITLAPGLTWVELVPAGVASVRIP